MHNLVTLIAEDATPEFDALARDLRAIGVAYEVMFKRDRPERVAALGITQFPCLLIGGRVVYHGPLDESDLRLILSGFEPTAALQHADSTGAPRPNDGRRVGS